MVEEKRKRFSAILQSLDVGDEPASLDSKDKLFRRSFIPALKHFFLGKAIERDIQLHGVKMLGVKLKPLFLGKFRRIKGPVPPMGIVIAARPDEDHPLTLSLSPADCVIIIEKPLLLQDGAGDQVTKL